jgi:hypothetical protein
MKKAFSNIFFISRPNRPNYKSKLMVKASEIFPKAKDFFSRAQRKVGKVEI